MADDNEKRILAKFKSESGDEPETNIIDLPLNVTVDHLNVICNTLLQQVCISNY